MSELKMTIQIDNILETEAIKSEKGEWKKTHFIGTETKGEYPKKVGFSIFGDQKVDNFLKYNKVGDVVEVSFNLQSNEYNGRVYTDAQAWKIWRLDKTTQETSVADEENDDLPF